MRTTAHQLATDFFLLLVGCGFLAAMAVMVLLGLLALLWEALTWSGE